MKIFVLEDDYNCKDVINWLRNKSDTIQIVDTIEDAFYYLIYEENYRDYDKYILDASLPGASVCYPDGAEKEYNGSVNGIDFVVDNFEKAGIDLNRIAVLTAFAAQAADYLKLKKYYNRIKIINKNDGDLTKRLQEFLDSQV